MRLIKKYYWRLKDKYLDFYNLLFYKNFRFEKTYFFKSDLQKNLHKYLRNDKNTILEIGTYEGLASIWLAKKYLKYKTSSLDIVDPFFLDDSTTEMANNTESNFLYNLARIKSKKITFHKTTSDDFFSSNKKIYNFIYIDGSHELEDIKKDLNNADKYLTVNGIIWCDDYGKKKVDCYIPIDEFYSDNQHRYEIVFKDYQIAFKKLAI